MAGCRPAGGYRSSGLHKPPPVWYNTWHAPGTGGAAGPDARFPFEIATRGPSAPKHETVLWKATAHVDFIGFRDEDEKGVTYARASMAYIIDAAVVQLEGISVLDTAKNTRPANLIDTDPQK